MWQPLPKTARASSDAAARPRVRWTGALAIVAAVIVLVAAACSGAGDGDAASTSTSSPQVETGQESAGGGNIDQFADTLVVAIDQHDVDTLNDLSCADAEEGVAAAIDMVDEVDAASALRAGEAEPGTYLVPLGIVMNGDARPYEATVVEQDGGFCVQNIAEDSYAGAGVPDEP